jgi:5-methylcytosine-specific restriction endonuclease McrA
VPYAIQPGCKEGGCPHRQPCPKHGGRREADSYYGTAAWRRLRAKQIQREPWCRACLLEGVLVPAVIADHIIPRRDGGPDELDNLQSLCRHHHNKTRGEESVRNSDTFAARRPGSKKSHAATSPRGSHLS